MNKMLKLAQYAEVKKKNIDSIQKICEQPSIDQKDKNDNNINNKPDIVKEHLKPIVLSDEKECNPISTEVVVPRPVDPNGYVGFANLPNQIYRSAVKKGFDFTLMVVGESGLGKSTLINSMFLADIYDPETHPGPYFRAKKTVNVESTTVLLVENGVSLKLTVVDTPGFGDALDNRNCWEPAINYINSKYEEYLIEESKVYRQKSLDTRVHCCLYFISPTGHGLRTLDIIAMQKIGKKVNLIPIIAKADTLTPEELQAFKKQILEEIVQNKIRMYDFPEQNEDDDEDAEMRHLRTRIPLAVVGANYMEEVDGYKIRGRRYPWGFIDVENLNYCDFVALRNLIIKTHMTDMKQITHFVHYENYRSHKLIGNNFPKDKVFSKNPVIQLEEEKRQHEMKLIKMKAEQEQIFNLKVKEKQRKIDEIEAEFTKKHEERTRAIQDETRDLEEKRTALEKQKEEFDKYCEKMSSKKDLSVSNGINGILPKQKKRSGFFS